MRPGSSPEATHQHVFDLDELLDAVERALATETGFLHTAKWCLNRARWKWIVQTDDAVFEAPTASCASRGTRRHSMPKVMFSRAVIVG